ncbi:hypothetical protein CLUG_02234 [Clavispora lusitaniae ATCC 42720]|uniref:Uncharacterized protein n=1 Tax=Clavispora lusitaniae (strain ATCC 42720) TaxID=306902 RepID=C4Y202_CLAL4|nr:uncharacterized protein CLUG_02234 [Clavispora lusitaniae ATCC 42720]EEQ38110.1 hypothetical protein CLUG_02234 [Clavispora lusitaniae ATCC 42720]
MCTSSWLANHGIIVCKSLIFWLMFTRYFFSTLLWASFWESVSLLLEHLFFLAWLLELSVSCACVLCFWGASPAWPSTVSFKTSLVSKMDSNAFGVKSFLLCIICNLVLTSSKSPTLAWPNPSSFSSISSFTGGVSEAVEARDRPSNMLSFSKTSGKSVVGTVKESKLDISKLKALEKSLVVVIGADLASKSSIHWSSDVSMGELLVVWKTGFVFICVRC